MKSLKSCPTLCDHMGCSPPGSSMHGILQQEYWSGLPFPSPRDLPEPRIEPRSPALQADSLPSESPGKFHNMNVFNDTELYTPKWLKWSILCCGYFTKIKFFKYPNNLKCHILCHILNCQIYLSLFLDFL